MTVNPASMTVESNKNQILSTGKLNSGQQTSLFHLQNNLIRRRKRSRDVTRASLVLLRHAEMCACFIIVSIGILVISGLRNQKGITEDIYKWGVQPAIIFQQKDDSLALGEMRGKFRCEFLWNITENYLNVRI